MWIRFVSFRIGTIDVLLWTRQWTSRFNKRRGIELLFWWDGPLIIVPTPGRKWKMKPEWLTRNVSTGLLWAIVPTFAKEVCHDSCTLLSEEAGGGGLSVLRTKLRVYVYNKTSRTVYPAYVKGNTLVCWRTEQMYYDSLSRLCYACNPTFYFTGKVQRTAERAGWIQQVARLTRSLLSSDLCRGIAHTDWNPSWFSSVCLVEYEKSPLWLPFQLFGTQRT
jgi:hypothetical protein